MDYILETNHIEKKYNNFIALKDVNMHIEKGAIYGLIGKNGAGKTTLIRIICGLQRVTKGNFKIYGVVNNSKEITKIKNKMGAIIEQPAIYYDMTAKENLIEQYKIIGLPVDNINNLLDIVGLSDVGNKKVKDFSLGMKQRLGIAIALVGRPDFLILDEPINRIRPRGNN